VLEPHPAWSPTLALALTLTLTLTLSRLCEAFPSAHQGGAYWFVDLGLAEP